MSGAARDPAELAVVVAGILTDAAVPYAIGGAIAYGFWGNPRGTRDLDVNLFVAAEDAGPAVDALAAGGIRLDRGSVLASAAARGDARVFYDAIPIDLFFLSIPLHESVARRVVEVALLGRTIRILSAEDLIVLKLLFFRGKDVVDVERMVAIQGAALDRNYVRCWLVECVGADAERVRKWDDICAALADDR